MKKVDDLDIQILKILRRNCKLSYRQIAKELNIATNTVKKRIERLEDEGIIKRYSATIDFGLLGYGLTAFVGIRCKRSDVSRIAEQLSKIPNVFGTYIVTGEFDIVVSCSFTDLDELNKFITTELSDPAIEITNTFIVLQTIKETHTFF
ncbi:MAG: Lrp/AsnC family transcriptional regulator [archaeon]